MALRVLNRVFGLIKQLIVETDAQDLIEYALLAGFIALAVVAGVTTLGLGLNRWYANIAGQAPGSP